MSLDLPFGLEPDPQEPGCMMCEDGGFIEKGDRVLPCPSCAAEAYNYALEVGPVDP